MKIRTKIIGIAVMLAATLSLIGFKAEAAEYIGEAEAVIESYTVANNDGGYVLKWENGEKRSASLAELIALIPDDAQVRFEALMTDEHIELTGNKRLTGSVSISGAGMTLSGKIVLAIDISLVECSVRIKSGEVSVESGAISASGASAFVLDRSSESRLNVASGRISTDSSKGAIYQELGSVYVGGGETVSTSGPAIVTSSSLYLFGHCIISGVGFDISSDRPVHASVGESYYSGELSVIMNTEFKKGVFTPVVYDSAKEQNGKFSIYDKSGLLQSTDHFESSPYTDEKNVIAVFDPFSASFFVGGELVFSESFALNDAVREPVAPERTGYDFNGWYVDSSLSSRYTFGVPEVADISLFASFSLSVPTFKVKSLSFVYDGAERALDFDELYHPLMEIGSFSFIWYKNSEEINNSAKSLKIKDVKDSGSYFCKLTFAYNGDFVTVDTPEVAVRVEKSIVEIPSVPNLTYTGSEQIHTVETSPLYTFSLPSVKDAGEYSATLSLIDPDNYKWEVGEEESISLSLFVDRAVNAFKTPPTVKDIYEGQGVDASASVLFGTVVLAFSSNGVDFSPEVPKAPGRYFARFSVAENENYTALVSEALVFTVIEEKCIGIKLEAYPDKSEYLAFEQLDLSGASVLAEYNSGRTARVDNGDISVEYKKGSCFLVGDVCAILSYGDLTVPVSVSVSPVDYDLSSISFSNKTVVYDGTRHTLSAQISVVGKDGIPLSAVSIGGGINAGEYEVKLEFSSSSVNYRVPAPLMATLVIEPMEVSAVYSNTDFTFDGAPKLPSGSATGVGGAKIKVVLTGARTDAGEYTAEAKLEDSNYRLLNSTVSFIIRKAIIDLSSALWSEGEFLYDGNAHSVSVSNLPNSVLVIGYTDASFTDAGEYMATAKLSYDENNYESPEQLVCSWRIMPREYDMSGVCFLDKNAIFCGSEILPDVVGEMPVGIDGIPLVYSFSKGAVNVDDGKVAVTVSFFSRSKNYKTPDSLVRFVTVSPKEIEVSWASIDFVYTGKPHLPIASSPFTELKVYGEGIEAGSYTAVCESLNANYKITNPSFSFTVAKANNEWLVPPSVSDYFESGAPSPEGTAKSGAPVFEYYLDRELSLKAELPLSPGEYYMSAIVEESENYLSLRSLAIPFSVIKVEPIALFAEPRGLLYANSYLTDTEVAVYYLNNDGSRTYLSFADIAVDYGPSGKLNAGEQTVSLKAGEMELELTLTVEKASFDMSSVRWSVTSLVYNGEEQLASLEGLPEGLSVEYICRGGKNAGEYELRARAIYDSQNYIEPIIPTETLIIAKCKIEIPTEEVFTYDGMTKAPTLATSSLYTSSYGEMKNAGEYTVVYNLSDPDNYAFSGTGETRVVIIPAPLKIKITGRDSYELLTGSIVDGDILGAEYYVDDGYIYLRIANENYEVELIPLKRGIAPGVIWLLVILILILAALFTVGGLILKKKPMVSGSEPHVENAYATVPHFRSESGAKEASAELTTLMAVDEEHANDLITDALAKSLISEEHDVVYTSGYKKCIVNLDTVSSVFNANDKIDINSMKEKGIISPEARYVKILGGGVLDKPLHISANSFSLSAAKMIALTGGSAMRVRTQRIRRNK